MKLIPFRTHQDNRRKGCYDVIPGLEGDMNFSKHPVGVIPEELHMHQRQTDYFVVVEGKVMFVLKHKNGRVEKVIVSEHDKKTVVISPGIWHGYTALKKATMLFYITHKFDTSDEFRQKCDASLWSVPQE